jgi:hypothetical protein
MLKGAIFALEVCALAGHISSAHAGTAFLPGPAFPVSESRLKISSQPLHRLSTYNRKRENFAAPSLRCSSNSDSKPKHGSLTDSIQQRLNECAMGLGLSTFMACFLLVAPHDAVAQQATQPESRAPAVTKSAGAPINVELPNVGGFKVPDELTKFPEDLTKQLGSIKVRKRSIIKRC